MSKYKIGLAKVEMGDIESDGGMGQSLTEIGDTVSDSMLLANDDDQTQEFFIEESDDPIKSIVSQRGALTLTWSCYNMSVQQLALFFGGTVTGDGSATPYKWAAPNNIPDLEQSLKITDKNDPATVIEIPRAQIRPRFNWNLNKSGLGQIDLVATVLVPTKAGEDKMSVTEELPA